MDRIGKALVTGMPAKLTTLATVAVLASCGPETSVASTNPSGTTPAAPTQPAIVPAPTASASAGAPALPVTNTAPASPTAAAPVLPPSAAGVNPAPAVQPPAATGAQPVAPAAATGGKKLAMDECNLHTNFAGDEYCILPPPPDKGFQAHWGPSNYDKPEAQYVMQPGQEDVVNMTVTSTNTSEVKYYFRQYRMRPGSHHVIFTSNGRRLGGTQNLAKDNPENGEIPPENEGVGMPLAARSPINANMHFYNVGEKPILREIWVNFWYKDPATVKETAKEVFSMTGVTAAVAHSHVVVGASCPIMGSGRVLSLYGHRHMNSVRFSIFHTTGGKKSLILEDYDPHDPAAFDFNSLITNPMPDASKKQAGAFSGILNLKQGDTLDFECEIINNTNKNFTGANEANDDEMCIMVGDSVGASVQPLCQAIPARRIMGN